MSDSYLDQLLANGEVLLIETRQHWIAAIRYVLRPILILLIAAGLLLLNSWLDFGDGFLGFINDLVALDRGHPVHRVHRLDAHRPGALGEPQVRAHQPPRHAHGRRPAQAQLRLLAGADQRHPHRAVRRGAHPQLCRPDHLHRLGRGQRGLCAAAGRPAVQEGRDGGQGGHPRRQPAHGAAGGLHRQGRHQRGLPARRRQDQGTCRQQRRGRVLRAAMRVRPRRRVGLRPPPSLPPPPSSSPAARSFPRSRSRPRSWRHLWQRPHRWWSRQP